MCILLTIPFMRRYTCIVNVLMCTYTCRHDYANFYWSYLQKGAAMSTFMCTYTTGHNHTHAYIHHAGSGGHAQVCMVKLIFTVHVYIQVSADGCYVYARM